MPNPRQATSWPTRCWPDPSGPYSPRSCARRRLVNPRLGPGAGRRPFRFDVTQSGEIMAVAETSVRHSPESAEVTEADAREQHWRRVRRRALVAYCVILV